MRLIDADEILINGIKNKTIEIRYEDLPGDLEMVFTLLFKDVRAFIDEQPTIDAVPVVRCKDCVHCPTEGEQDVRFPDDVCPCQCEDYYYSWIPRPNWFCPKGEKVTE